VGLFAALVALQNDPSDCQDLVAGQEFVLVSLDERLPDIAARGTGNLHRDIGRHDPAFDRDEEPLLAMIEQITNRRDIIGGEVDLRGDLGVCVTSLAKARASC
jgi:hypothetical protein